MVYHGYVAVQGRGLVSLPVELRRRLKLDAPGAQLEITERQDGVLEFRPQLPFPADQAWFWTEQWQQREHEVDHHLRIGEHTLNETTDEFLADLDSMSANE